MAPKVTEAHLEARRQQVLDAALECFARQGFHQTTIQDICREAELSPGAVYRYFASKEEIIEASCEACQQDSIATIASAVEKGDALDVLDELTEAAFAEIDRPDAHTRLQVNVQWWSEALRNQQLKDSLCGASIDLWKGALAEIVERAQAQPEIDPDLDPVSAGRVLLSMWQGLVLQKALDPRVDVQQYLEVVKAMYGGTFRHRGEVEGQAHPDNFES